MRLLKLVNNTFCKVVMVKDYESALRIAKDSGLTCVTPELQVVYAGAFITKVGSQGRTANNAASTQSRISLYSKIQELTRTHEQKQNIASQMNEAKSELNQDDLNSMRMLQRCEVKQNHYKQALSELNFAKHELTGQLNTRQAKQESYRSTASRYEQQI